MDVSPTQGEGMPNWNTNRLKATQAAAIQSGGKSVAPASSAASHAPAATASSRL